MYKLIMTVGLQAQHLMVGPFPEKASRS